MKFILIASNKNKILTKKCSLMLSRCSFIVEINSRGLASIENHCWTYGFNSVCNTERIAASNSGCWKDGHICFYTTLAFIAILIADVSVTLALVLWQWL